MPVQLITDAPGDIDLPGSAQPFQPGSNIDAVAVNILIVGNHIPALCQCEAVNGDRERPGVMLGHSCWISSARYTALNCAVELDQESVPGNAGSTAACPEILGSIEVLT